MFIEEGDKSYKKFCKQFGKLSAIDQLATINYIIFAYTENVFLNPDLHEKLKEDEIFMDVCRKTTDFTSSLLGLFEDPLTTAIKEFSLTHRNEIPNLLSAQYALKGCVTDDESEDNAIQIQSH